MYALPSATSGYKSCWSFASTKLRIDETKKCRLGEGESSAA